MDIFAYAADREPHMSKHSCISSYLCIFCIASCFAANNHRPLTAISTGNNDIAITEHPKGKTVEIPIHVLNVIDSIVHTDFERRKTTTDSVQLRDLSVDAFYGPVFRITAPGNRYLFIFKEEDVVGILFYYLIMYDHKSGRTTANPPSVYGKWMEGGDWGAELTKPLVFFDTSEGGETPKLIFEERVHNGTGYNAIIYHYYDIASDYSFRQVLALETRLSDVRTEDEGGIIQRMLKRISRDSLMIETTLNRYGHEDEYLGDVLVVRTKDGLPFHVARRNIKNQIYRDILITGSPQGTNEDEFLAKGCSFYY